MNVLHVVHFPVFGGPHNQALRLAQPLRERGFATIVVVPDEPGNAALRLRAGGVAVRAIPLKRLRATADLRTHLAFALAFPADIGRLRSLIRTEGIDIVQIGGLVNPHAAIAARLERVPVVWQLLDTRAPWPISAMAMAFVQRLADVVMSTGMTVAAAHPGYSAIADRTIPFYPPVDLEKYAPRPSARLAIRAQWGVPASALVVGCVANINPQKGIDALVDAFARARTGAPDARLVLVGAEYPTHAEYTTAVHAQIAARGLVEGQDVLFVGERDDVELQLAAMDLFALAAAPRSEGVTTAALEAMACGLPVVVTDVGALREAVDSGRTGLVVPAGDQAAFGGALARLMGDPALRSEMGENARLDAERMFGVETSAEAHVRAYAQALAVRDKGGRRRGLEPARAAPALPPANSEAEGIPIYLDGLDAIVHDEIDHHHAPGHKAAQVAHFDRLAEATFEIDRPHGTPRLYRFLLAEKFRRSVSPIRPRLAGASALTVCGGSGMDAEFLARAGADVITSDLSLGAAIRAKKRSERHGVAIHSIVADVEHLPFDDQTVDIVAVHDGLHHLADPNAGLAEMARVARRWVVVTEPARASVTRLAVRLGLALETEEAGNRVARLDPSEVAAYLRSRGFLVLRAERYAMYYPHQPGRVFKMLSRPYVFPVIRAGWRIANAMLGRFGNKMVVIAERPQPSAAVAPSGPPPERTTS